MFSRKCQRGYRRDNCWENVLSLISNNSTTTQQTLPPEVRVRVRVRVKVRVRVTVRVRGSLPVPALDVVPLGGHLCCAFEARLF
jgi:hypothetical protein